MEGHKIFTPFHRNINRREYKITNIHSFIYSQTVGQLASMLQISINMPQVLIKSHSSFRNKAYKFLNCRKGGIWMLCSMPNNRQKQDLFPQSINLSVPTQYSQQIKFSAYEPKGKTIESDDKIRLKPIRDHRSRR